MVMVAAAETAELLSEVAVSFTVGGLGTFAGAVYLRDVPDAVEVAESVPQAEPLQPAPESFQVTPALLGSL